MRFVTVLLLVNIFLVLCSAKKAKSNKKNERITRQSISELRKQMPPFKFPEAKGYVKLNQAMIIKAGQTFDGGMKRYDVGVPCMEQIMVPYPRNGVFILETGATLQNVIIGPDQSEGIHCVGDGCTLKNVWWEQVCEDGFSTSPNQKGVFKILGGGAKNGEDKMFQSKASGTLIVSDFSGYNLVRFISASCDDNGNGNTIQVKNTLLIGHKGTDFLKMNCKCNPKLTITNVTLSDSVLTCFDKGGKEGKKGSKEKKGGKQKSKKKLARRSDLLGHVFLNKRAEFKACRPTGRCSVNDVSCCKPLEANIKRIKVKEPAPIKSDTGRWENVVTEWRKGSQKMPNFSGDVPEHVRNMVKRYIELLPDKSAGGKKKKGKKDSKSKKKS